MSVANPAPLVLELRQQLCLIQELHYATGELLAVCSGEQPDQLEVAALLAKRQKLMAEATESLSRELTAETTLLAAPGGIMAEIIFASRSLLEKTAVLDQQIRKELLLRRDRVKQELMRLQAGKAAGKAYGAKIEQLEGFFLDSKAN